ncbi:hypothetical protein WJT74_01185 [Sphingomicrobium sp. XHP0239]|uniref:hypothetical protein n=1 Tax=Sphingomicrobium maritimum TaxID=3133972 RepID=UPI0031CC84D7
MEKQNIEIVPLADRMRAAAVLRESHRDRCKISRKEKADRAAQAQQASSRGTEKSNGRKQEHEDRTKTAFMRRKRQLEDLERAREHARLGASIRREERRLFRRSPPTQLFKQFEAKQVARGPTNRDLYFEWIGRGLSSGRGRNYARSGTKRTSSRTTPWKSGEMGRKIRYIGREAALENVEGNVVTNMGDDMGEAVHCSQKIEEIERLARKGAGVYIHVIVALSHENSPTERVQVLAELVQPLRRMGLPYYAALHHPDQDGDQRNYHAHLVLSLRPMKRITAYQWEFSASKSTWLNTPAGLKLQRKFVARTLNRALAAGGHRARWTYLSRAERGEVSPGNTKKGAERTRQERAVAKAETESREARKAFFESGRLRQAATRLLNAGDKLERCWQICSELLIPVRKGMSEALHRLENEIHEFEDACVTALKRQKQEIEAGEAIIQAIRSLQTAEARAAANHPIKDESIIPVLRRVRSAITNMEFSALHRGDGSYALSASEEPLLADWEALRRSKEGEAYCREISAALPEPEADQSEWPSRIFPLLPESEEISADDLFRLWKESQNQGRG